MWWKKATKEPPDLEERLAKVERRLMDVELEWQSVHDKLVTLVARYNKRAQRAAELEPPAEPANVTPTGPPIATSHLDPISQRILNRRQRMFGPRPAGNSTEEEKTG